MQSTSKSATDHTLRDSYTPFNCFARASFCCPTLCINDEVVCLVLVVAMADTSEEETSHGILHKTKQNRSTHNINNNQHSAGDKDIHAR